MQDRLTPDRRKPLATRGRTIHWVNRVTLVVGRRFQSTPINGHRSIQSACLKGAKSGSQPIFSYSMISSARAGWGGRMVPIEPKDGTRAGLDRVD
jgi:hypothetical protein